MKTIFENRHARVGYEEDGHLVQINLDADTHRFSIDTWLDQTGAEKALNAGLVKWGDDQPGRPPT